MKPVFNPFTGIFDWVNTASTETDPVFTAWLATKTPANWDTAYSWGNHATAGYLTSATAATTYLKLDQTTPQTLTASPYFNNLTAGRVVYVGANKDLTDSANLTFSGTDLTVLGRVIADGTTGGFYRRKTLTANSTYPSLNISTIYEWTGSGATISSSTYEATDHRVVTGGFSDSMYGLRIVVKKESPASTVKNPNFYGVDFSLTDTGTHTTGSTASTVACMRAILLYAPTFNTGGTISPTVSGFDVSISASLVPTLSSGTLNQTSYGYRVYGTAHTVGTHTLYDFYTSVTGADTHYGFYNAGTGHNLLGNDNVKTYFGTGLDASIYYDATNLVINPKDVGTGYLDIKGVVYATRFYNNTSGGNAFQTSRVHTTTAGSGIALYEEYNYAGTGFLSAISSAAYDKRTIVGGKSNGVVNLNFGAVNQAAINANNYTGYGIQGYYQNNATYTYAGSVTTVSIGFTTTIAEIPTVNIGAGNTYTNTAYGYRSTLTTSSPTVTSGNYVQNTYIYYAEGAGNTVGTQTGYDFYSSVTGFDTHYCFYNVGSGHNLLGNDNVLTYFGTGLDASIYYDGTNLCIAPQEVGSGVIDIKQATGAAPASTTPAAWLDININGVGYKLALYQ